MINQHRNIFIYVFAMFQEVSLSMEYCGDYWCIDGICCFDTCCPKKPEILEMPSILNSPSIMAVAIFATLVGFVCFLAVCIVCCKKSGHPEEQEPTRNQPIPPPTPSAPTVPPLILDSDPPPYSEVVGKPDFYPIPVEPPPCYDNIAMEDLSSWRVLSHHDQGSPINF